jgi:hypothetical protein
MSKLMLVAMIASLAVLSLCGSLGVLACSSAQEGPPSSKQDEGMPPTATSGATADLEPVVRADVGETVEMESGSTIVIPRAFKTEEDPKVGDLNYQGTFVLLDIDYTPGGKYPVQIPPELPLRLTDSEGRTYYTDQTVGIVGSYTYNSGRSFDEMQDTVNPGVVWKGADAFQVPPDAQGFTLYGGDLACPDPGPTCSDTYYAIDLGF